jgi:hypothetical protein
MTKHRTQRVSRLRRRKTLRGGLPPEKIVGKRAFQQAAEAAAAAGKNSLFGVQIVKDDGKRDQRLFSRGDQAAAKAAANAELAAADKALEEATAAREAAEKVLEELDRAARGPGKATAEKAAAKAAADLPEGWTRHGPDVENDVWYENSKREISQFSNPNYPDMPPYWVEQQDAKTGEVWFANKNTKASQWERPKAGGKRRRIRGGEKPSIPHVQVPKPSGQPPPPTPGGRRR